MFMREGTTGNMAAITALVSREKLAQAVEKNPSCPKGCSVWAPNGMLGSEKMRHISFSKSSKFKSVLLLVLMTFCVYVQ